MNGPARNFDTSTFSGLYRDRENGWIFGVCAGLADRYNLQLPMVRLVALLGLFLFFWLFAALYLAATLLIREKPLIYSGRYEEYEFWRRRDDSHWRNS